MFGKPRNLIANLFGEFHLIHHLLVNLAWFFVAITLLEQAEKTKVHMTVLEYFLGFG